MLVLRPGALGDTLLAVPALRALRRRYAPLTLAAHGGAARLLCELGEVDTAIAFDEPQVGRVLRGDSAGEAVVAWMNPGVAPRLRAQLIAPSRPSDDTHVARYLLHTLAPLGVTQELDDTPLRVEPLPGAGVLVHPGSGSARKNWPAERFAELIDQLPTVRLIVGEADQAAANAIEARLGRQLPRLEQPALTKLAQQLAGCRAYIGNDSGVSQLAGLCGAPAFVLFGPTSAAQWKPLGPHVYVRAFDVEPRALASDVLR